MEIILFSLICLVSIKLGIELALLYIMESGND